MLPLRYPWLWLAIGWLLVLGVIVGSLVPGQDLHALERVNDKFMHAGSYFLLMLWFAGVYTRTRHVLLAILLFALGAGLDIAQLGTATRTFDLRDIAADGVGILIAFVLSRLLLEGWCQKVERFAFNT